MHEKVSPTSQPPDGPVYLTAAGRRRLEEQVARYRARVAAWRGDADELAVDDWGDAAERLIEADDLSAVQDLLAATQAALARAVPMPEGPDDGIVRLGSTLTVREGEGQSTLMVVDRAELDDGGTRVSVDSAVGRALLGRARGDRVAIEVPAGLRVLTVQSVEPYRERAA